MSDDAGVPAEDAAAAQEAPQAPPGEAVAAPQRPGAAHDPAAASAPGEQRTAVVVGLTARARERLSDALPGWTLVDDAEAEGADLAVVSSRADAESARALVSSFCERGQGHLVVITHPGGESATIDLLSNGATLALPEGREHRIPSLFADASLAHDLVDAYVTWAGSTSSRSASHERDEHAGVPGPMAFADALAEATTGATVPRVVIVSARDLDVALRQMNSGIANLLRRRIAQQVQTAVRPFGATVFALDTTHFATLLPDDEDVLERMVEPLRIAIESYAPVRGRSLRLAVGHAGAQDATDPAILGDLAERACAVAVETGRRVVSAADLVEAVADRTHLLTMLGAIDLLESREPTMAGHAARVADLSVALGEALGLERVDLGRLGTAARFHDVGKLGLPTQVQGDVEGLTGDDLARWQTHVERSATALTPAAGTIVATIVRHHHERFDGTGFPLGLTGDAIPIASRIIAVADAFDVALTRRPGPGVGFDEATRAVIDGAGTAWDRQVVDALVQLVQRRRLPHSLSA